MKPKRVVLTVTTTTSFFGITSGDGGVDCYGVDGRAERWLCGLPLHPFIETGHGDTFRVTIERLSKGAGERFPTNPWLDKYRTRRARPRR